MQHREPGLAQFFLEAETPRRPFRRGPHRNEHDRKDGVTWLQTILVADMNASTCWSEHSDKCRRIGPDQGHSDKHRMQAKSSEKIGLFAAETPGMGPGLGSALHEADGLGTTAAFVRIA